MTREEFIHAAKKKHGNQYDYSQVTDAGVENCTVVPIKCSEHGMFWETPYMHLNGLIHCFDCYKEKEWDRP